MTDEGILRQAKELKEYVIDCRRKIHQYAEVSGTEKKTSTFIQSEMESMGLPWEMVSKTGLIATLETGRPGPHIALSLKLKETLLNTEILILLMSLNRITSSCAPLLL